VLVQRLRSRMAIIQARYDALNAARQGDGDLDEARASALSQSSGGTASAATSSASNAIRRGSSATTMCSLEV
jgi:hypothetical protein